MITSKQKAAKIRRVQKSLHAIIKEMGGNDSNKTAGIFCEFMAEVLKVVKKEKLSKRPIQYIPALAWIMIEGSNQ